MRDRSGYDCCLEDSNLGIPGEDYRDEWNLKIAIHLHFNSI